MDARSPQPTNIRLMIVFVTAMTAVFMYVDRACLSQLKPDIAKDLAIEKVDMDWIMSSFFWSYAFAQVPAGFCGSLFGMRRTLTIMLFTWSLCTVVCGLATGFASLFVARLAVGIAEAGAYPTAASIVKGWFPLAALGRANSFVALGGRGGFALSQMLTPVLAALPLFGWKGVLILYGALGMVWAGVFWIVVRDKASMHPWANASEVQYAGSNAQKSPVVQKSENVDNSGSDLSDSDSASKAKGPPPLIALLSSWNMWCFGFAQFGSNMGWAFLITNLPEMLLNYFGCESAKERGNISSIPMWASCGGMFLGGFIGDFYVKRYGLKWGRKLPISLMLFMAGMAYIGCICITEPRVASIRDLIPIQDAWLVAIALACMAVSVDIGIPSIWAFAQDVGGKHVGAALGFGNMVGNLGAAASPLLLGYVQRNYGYNNMFLVCAGSFIMASIFTLGMNATKPVIQD